MMRRYHSSLLLWNTFDKVAFTWKRLDRVLQGKHDRFLDELFGSLKGYSVFHPYKYYQDGWGDSSIPTAFCEWLKSKLTEEVVEYRPKEVDICFGPEIVYEGVKFQEGTFATSATEISNLLPRESLQARALFVSPVEAYQADRPTVVLLPGTGEHGYDRRASSIAFPLAVRAGISSVILESPFYGSRRPPNQPGSKLRTVSDLAVLGRTTIEETTSILRYLSERRSLKNLAVAGVSMGGLHSAMTASLFQAPVGVVSWLGPPSAVPVFTEGLLARFCEWNQLQTQVGKTECARKMMKQFLALSNLDNFPKPKDPTRGIFVIAENDLYVPKEHSIRSWHALQKEKWHGAQVAVIPGGHVSATLFGAENFRRCIEKVLNVRKDDPLDNS